MSKDKEDVDWVLLAKLKQLVLGAPSQPTGSQVDGGKESQGPVDGTSSTAKGAQQKDEKPSKTDGVQQLQTDGDVPSPSSSPNGKPSSTNEPVPDQQLQPSMASPTNIFASLSDEQSFALRQRLVGGGGPTLREKHYYSVGNVNLNPTAGVTNTFDPLAGIIQGSGYSNIAGLSIRIKHCSLRVYAYLDPVQVNPAKLPEDINVRYGTVINKIPKTPGSAPSLFQADTLPPNVDTVFSGLGTAGMLGGGTTLCVRSPVTAKLYDVQQDEKRKLLPEDGANMSLASGGAGVVYFQPMGQHFYMETKGNFRVDFTIQAGPVFSPIANAPWFFMKTDNTNSMADMNLTCGIWYVTHTIFEDETAIDG